MKAIIYNLISSQEQETLPLKQRKQNVKLVNENGFCFIVCNRCGGEWIANTLSGEELRGRKCYPKPKCPVCE